MSATKYQATVTNIEDPEKRGRFKVACPQLLLNSDQEMPHWVEPELQHGWFTLPYLGQQVIIEIDEQSEDGDEVGIQNLVMSAILKWKGEVVFTNKEYDNPNIIDPLFTSKNYKNRRGYVNKKGHYVIFDETDNDESITISWKNKAKQTSNITLNKYGSVLLENAKGSTVIVDAKTDTIDIKHHSGPEIELTNTDININATNITSKSIINNTLESESLTDIKGLNINIQAIAAVNVSGATVVLDATLLKLKPSAINALIQSIPFITLFDNHVHVPPGVSEPPGFTGRPTIPLLPLISTFTEPTVLV